MCIRFQIIDKKKPRARQEWQQCRKEKNEEEFSSTENIGAAQNKAKRHRIVTNAGNFSASFLSIFTTHYKLQDDNIFFCKRRIYFICLKTVERLDSSTIHSAFCVTFKVI